MFKLFKKKPQGVPFVAPATGAVIPLEDVADPVFAGKMMGDGFAVAPTDGAIVAPVAGVVSMIAETKHGIGIRCDNGLEVLIHMGIDTVALNGAPFTVEVVAGQAIAAGAPLATMDLAAIEAAGKATTVMVVVTNTAERGAVVTPQSGAVASGALAATVAVSE